MDRFIKLLKAKGLQEGLLTAQQVSIVLRHFADWAPFENVDVMRQHNDEITPEFLINKIVERQRGGLCYEMNPLLYLVLKKLGFHVELGAATVIYDGTWQIEGTHIMVLLTMGEKRYIADAGFGNKLALSPLELDGAANTSPGGTFRVRSVKTEKGTIALQSYLNEEWVNQYVFDWAPVEWNELNRVKNTIHQDPRSPFNKQLLIASVLPDGTRTINEDRFLFKGIDGEDMKPFDSKGGILNTIRTHCSQSIAEDAGKYLNS